MKPHAIFKITRADEVAECWDGVSKELYLKLWNKIVPLQKEVPNIEDSGPGDHVGHENLASHWKHLSVEEQSCLNELAEKKQAEFDAWWNSRETTEVKRQGHFEDCCCNSCHASRLAY